MSQREKMLYDEARAKDPGVGSFEEFFFFPTGEDMKMAKRLSKRLSEGFRKGNTKLAAAIQLVANGTAVPAALLDEVRDFNNRGEVSYTERTTPAKGKRIETSGIVGPDYVIAAEIG